MKIVKHASAVWQGGIKDGGGTISTETGVLKDAPYGFKARFEDKPQPEWSRIDVQVELDPPRQFFKAKGVFTLENRTASPITDVLVTVDPTFDWKHIRIDGVVRAPEVTNFTRVFRLSQPLAPGAQTRLRRGAGGGAAADDRSYFHRADAAGQSAGQPRDRPGAARPSRATALANH